MREFHWPEEKILKAGYYRMNRWWSVLNEVRAHESHNSGVLAMIPYDDKLRNQVFESLKRLQPRRHRLAASGMPKEIENKIRARWAEMEKKRKLSKDGGSKSKAGN